MYRAALFVTAVLSLTAFVACDMAQQHPKTASEAAQVKCEAEARRAPKINNETGSLANAANRAQRDNIVRTCMTDAGFLPTK